MRARQGLTVFELIVVIIAIVALIAFVFWVVSWSAGRGARLGMCQSNLYNIGIACGMYAEDTRHRGYWMWVSSDNWTTPTGDQSSIGTPYTQDISRAITTLLFMLVRRGHCGLGLFMCPAREGAEVQREVNLSDDPSTAEYDFRDPKYVSYSYAAPVLTANAAWISGADPTAENPAKIAVLADKNPAMDGGGSGPWGDNISDKQRKSWLSRNHGGESINVLWLDYHVSRESRADIGIDDDCIYTAGGDPGPSRSATSTNLSSHKDPHDSFLIGPYGKR